MDISAKIHSSQHCGYLQHNTVDAVDIPIDCITFHSNNFFILGILSVSSRIVCLRISICTTRFMMLSNGLCQWCLVWIAKSLLNDLDIVPSLSCIDTLTYVCSSYNVPVGLIVLQDSTAIHVTVYGTLIEMVTMVPGIVSHHSQWKPNESTYWLYPPAFLLYLCKSVHQQLYSILHLTWWLQLCQLLNTVSNKFI